MSKFLLGDMRETICGSKHGRRKHQPNAELRQAGTTFVKLPAADRKGARATQHRPSRATRVLLARRLRDIREGKGFSQSDISRLLALRRAYISRVEGAEHIPPLRILQRWARALEVSLYQLFYDDKTPPEQLRNSELQTTTEVAANVLHDRYFRELARLLPRLSESNQKLLLEMAQTIHRRGPRALSLAQRQDIPRAIAD